GRLHGGVAKVVQRFLDCGLLESGFVRVHCRRWLEKEILDDVPHRQYLFTLPKRLRPYFDRRLLGLLSRVACVTLREFLRASLREPAAVPASSLASRPSAPC
ncbi:MAG: hypothetical protein U0166_29770, partial [Acidobacteriota bacterium]